MLRISLTFIMFLVVELLVHSQPPGYNSVKDEKNFRMKFKETSTNLSTIQADFVQEKNLSVLSEKIVSKGRFWFKKQSMVRMEYFQPYKYLMVINKDRMSVKDEHKTTTFSSRNNKMLEYVNKIIIDCVQGTAIDSKEFSVKIFESSKNYLLQLEPSRKEMRDFFADIRIYIDKNDYSVFRMDMDEPGGDNTSFIFNNRIYNEEVANTLFVID